jgi:lipopolysaccharide biosynthesis glycosyltransferase
MIVDVEFWRQNGVSDISERFLLRYSDSLHSHDQHTLNLIFGDAWSKLPLRWNYMEDYYRFRHRSGAYSAEEIEAARKHPAIVHYAVGSDKPWRRDCEHPRADLYRRYWRSLKAERAGLRLADPQENGWLV